MKIKKRPKEKDPLENESITLKTTPKKASFNDRGELAQWWLAKTPDALAVQLCSTAAYLKQNQMYRIRQIAANVRMYANLPVYNYAGSNLGKMDKSKTLPDQRPTFNLIQACVDTLVSRMSQSRPEPKFLTDNGDYKQRHLAQQLNQFILGEFHQTHMYEKSTRMLQDCLITGTGALKIYEGDDEKVCVDRVRVADLYVDDNDSIDGDPRQLYQLKLMDRDKLIAQNPKNEQILMETSNSFPDQASEQRSTADQVMVVEGWRLPSGPDPKAKGYVPGRHTIATTSGILFDEPFDKMKFPFVFMSYSDPYLGYWGQGIATQLFGTQLTLGAILYTISRAICIVGVPRVFIEQGSKVAKATNNNEIGVMVTYSGTKPSYEVAPCNAPELYAERDRLIQYGFQQTGVSAMQATSSKPDGLNSGAAIRANDDIATDRFASLARKYDNVFIDAAYLIAETAKDIADRTGKYQTIYPNKNGTKEIDLPAMKFLNDPFVIQCFNESSLPRTPAGRIATVTEQIQAGILTLKEGRRLMHFPDLEQNEVLDNASEERIFKILDGIVEDGSYEPPDIFMDLQVASDLVVKYLNLYLAHNLEEKKAEMLRKFFKQVQTLIQSSTPPPMVQPTPQANPQPAPTSPMIPNAPNQ